MARIGIIAPDSQLYNKIPAIARELGIENDVALRLAVREEALSVAQYMEENGADVIVSRGATVEMLLHSGIRTPIVTISLSIQDISTMLLKAKELTGLASPRIAVVTYTHITLDLRILSTLVDADLRVYHTGYSREAVENTVQAALRDGVDVIGGGPTTQQVLSGYATPFIAYETGASSVRQALTEAKRIADARKLEQERASEFKAVVTAAKDAIVTLAPSGRIRLANPGAVQLLRLPPDPVDEDILAYYPVPEIRECLKTGEAVTDELVTVAEQQTLLSVVPTLVRGEVTGAVLICRPAQHIVELEAKIRKSLSDKGLVAKHTVSDIIGESAQIQAAKQKAVRFAAVDDGILIHGETGTGKEVFAQAIHNAGPRAKGPFVALNCAALPPTLLENVPLPKMVRVAQKFEDNSIADVVSAVRREIQKPEIAGRVTKGMRIALAVGSRGVDKIPLITRTIAEELRTLGAEPFVVPGMGSHGGATAEGQAAVLASLGVTEESVGCPIVSSMDTVELGRLPNGLPVLMDANAMAADGIVPINRVKPHTSYSGEIESGVAKMLSIGLGKHKGAASCHTLGFGKMAEHVVAMAKIKIAGAPVLFGFATIENAFDKVCKVAAIPAEGLIEEEKKLLLEAKAAMPRILFTPLDVLVVDVMGKEFSGTGTDPNITGRAATPYVDLSQQTGKMVILDLSDATKGNAAGVGLADLTTRRLFDKINFEYTYINHLTSTVLSHAKIPVMMDTDKLAVQAALKTCNVPDFAAIRLVHVKNTLHIGEIRISESMLGEAKSNPKVEMVSEPEEWRFDAAGNLTGLGTWI